MKPKRWLSVLIGVLILTQVLCLSGCVTQTAHKAVYQNGKLLGEWNLHSRFDMVAGSKCVTTDGRRVVTIVAPGIPLDTVHVGGGVAVITLIDR